MSHFPVLVIGPDYTKQLAPYHEFECTGLDDEFVQDIDETEALRKSYESETTTVYVRVSNGALVENYGDMFYREWTDEEREKVGLTMGAGIAHGIQWWSKDWGDGKGYRSKVHFLPEGYRREERQTRDHKTFAEYIEDECGWKELTQGLQGEEHHQYGFVEVDEAGKVVRVVKRTNPDARWDWYVVGGRWCGFFPLKPGAEGVAGKGAGAATGLEPDKGTADHLLLRNVDFDRAWAEATLKANAIFDQWDGLVKEHGEAKPWSYFLAKHEADQGAYPLDKAREDYRAQPLIAASRKVEDFKWRRECCVDEFSEGREAYAQKCRDRALTPWAIVKDGKWHENGKMGWFGMSDDKIDKREWRKRIASLYADLPPDTILTLVDCHI